jgi:hypothetical protein
MNNTPIPLPTISEKTNSKSSLKKKSLTKIYDSNASLNTKRAQLVKTARPTTYGLATQAGIEEIVRLTKVMDQQKDLITRLADELKTLKIASFLTVFYTVYYRTNVRWYLQDR